MSVILSLVQIFIKNLFISTTFKGGGLIEEGGLILFSKTHYWYTTRLDGINSP